jgi:hypothetical protein
MSGRTREIWAAKDGNVSYGLRGGAARIPNLKATVAYMDECGMAPQWLKEYDWDAYDYASLSDAEIERLEAAFGAFFASRSMRELYAQALERRILLAPCNDAREMVEHAQLRDRNLFVRVDYPHLGASIEHPDFFAKLRTADRAAPARRGSASTTPRSPGSSGPASALCRPRRRRSRASIFGPARARDRLGAAGRSPPAICRARRAVIRIESREQPTSCARRPPRTVLRRRRRCSSC